MKITTCRFALLLACVALASCSKDDDVNKDPDINHVGEKWNITSVEYTIVDQNLGNPSQAVKTGTQANAGAFYFDGSKGSFDIQIEDIHKEDVFSFTVDGNDVTIISITQSVGASSFSQFVIALSGEKPTATTMTLSGTITKQSISQQFVLTGAFQLTKN